MTRPAQQHRGGGATDVRLPQQRASQSKVSQPRAGQSKASQSKGAQSKGAQPRTGQAKAAQPRAGQPKAAQSRAGQPPASQSRSAQPRAGQSKAAQTRSRRPATGQSGAPQSRSAQPRSAHQGSAHQGSAHQGSAQPGMAQSGGFDTGPTEIWDAAPQPPVRQPGSAPRYQPGARRTSGQPLCAAWDPLADDGPRARQARGRRRPPPQDRRGMSGFFRNYGWRAYALPVLLVLTALAGLEAGQPSILPIGSSAGTPPSAADAAPTVPPTTAEPTPTPLVPNPAGNEKYDAAKVSAELPAGGPFTEGGTGNWLVIPGSTERFGAGELFTYTVEIEEGVQLPGGPEGFARTVDATLNNPKSWIGSAKYAFQRIDTGTPRIRISLASQQTARSICGFKIQFDASCWRGGRTVLNAARWERGAVVFQGNVIAYQQYVVNHEVGHALGFGHRPCAEHGALAPIMMQQTWGVSNDYLAVLGTDNVEADGKVCAANPWPYPTQGG